MTITYRAIVADFGFACPLTSSLRVKIWQIRTGSIGVGRSESDLQAESRREKADLVARHAIKASPRPQRSSLSWVGRRGYPLKTTIVITRVTLVFAITGCKRLAATTHAPLSWHTCRNKHRSGWSSSFQKGIRTTPAIKGAVS